MLISCSLQAKLTERRFLCRRSSRSRPQDAIPSLYLDDSDDSDDDEDKDDVQSEESDAYEGSDLASDEGEVEIDSEEDVDDQLQQAQQVRFCRAKGSRRNNAERLFFAALR